jgi:N5-(cytidine 5'-diphosphoramidyl)-L-glutamine hydrolase
MTLVAVSQRVDEWPERGERRDALDQRLVAWLVHAGCVPVPVPNLLCSPSPDRGLTASPLVDWLARVAPQAIVLSGGQDIGQCPERDCTEMALLDHARRHALPVLGLCRGMQLMAHWAGTGLHPVSGHVRTRHRLQGHIQAEVNSFHGLALRECPADFDVLAVSEDGEIEAVAHRHLPWAGWMWHPEREAHFAEHDLARLKELFRA